MRLASLVQRYSLLRKPTLKAANPRLGTSIIPLDQSDVDIFFQYLTNKIHALSFEGRESQLRDLLDKLVQRQGFKIHKIRTSVSRDQSRFMLIHLKCPNDSEIRRVIRMS
jgi:hypothetical protein